MTRITVLDQSDKVNSIDKNGMLELCEKTPEFCRDAIERAENTQIPYKLPQNIIIVGMGGSAIGGDLLKDWLYNRASVTIEVCRDYHLPAYANQESLIIALSYSGETEETLNAFLEAVKRGCLILTLSSGGRLQKFSKKLKIPRIEIPSNLPPRAALAYTFFPLVILMKKLGIIKDIKGEVQDALNILQTVREENALRVPSDRNEAKKIAAKINGTIPIIYGFRRYRAVARRLKCQFNENSKIPSKFEAFSELNHNEVVGWEAPMNLTDAFSLLLLRDPLESPEIKQRIEITKQMISPKVSKILEIQAMGTQELAKMLSTMYIGDFVSIYLALLRGVDPTPTKSIDHLKAELKQQLSLSTRFDEEIEKLM
ncbi:MAG: bifunctional phosphoglucose/phosphomannose isomerase [Candidatus Bathyarchaeota archaeon]|nr:MAG: bifunctional phosphoglucose/phosphomannose isomerase [Candidatus Bathyarchaeota archaeon]